MQGELSHRIIMKLDSDINPNNYQPIIKTIQSYCIHGNAHYIYTK